MNFAVIIYESKSYLEKQMLVTRLNLRRMPKRPQNVFMYIMIIVLMINSELSF